MKLVYLLGVTNVGKSTFVKAASRTPGCAVVEVGKVLRSRYPPDHFKGQGAPAHTQDEAWRIMLEQIAEGERAGAGTVFIDGQPRCLKQVRGTLALDAIGRPLERHARRFVLLTAPWETRLERALRRDASDWLVDPALSHDLRAVETPLQLAELLVLHESRDRIPAETLLSLQRLVNDPGAVLDVVASLLAHGQAVEAVDVPGSEDVLPELVRRIRDACDEEGRR